MGQDDEGTGEDSTGGARTADPDVTTADPQQQGETTLALEGEYILLAPSYPSYQLFHNFLTFSELEGIGFAANGSSTVNEGAISAMK